MLPGTGQHWLSCWMSARVDQSIAGLQLLMPVGAFPAWLQGEGGGGGGGGERGKKRGVTGRGEGRVVFVN